MKKFTLEEYLKNPDKKIVTRDGRNARIRCTDVKRAYFPILALVDNGVFEAPISYTKNGEYMMGEESCQDLFFAPEKYEGWINIYRDNGTRDPRGGYIYNSKEEAKKEALPEVITTIKVEWEE